MDVLLAKKAELAASLKVTEEAIKKLEESEKETLATRFMAKAKEVKWFDAYACYASGHVAKSAGIGSGYHYFLTASGAKAFADKHGCDSPMQNIASATNLADLAKSGLLHLE
jgi:hypothetical protein